MKRRLPRALSLHGLLLLYLATAVVVFLLLAANLLYRIDEIHDVAQQEREAQARADLRAAFEQAENANHRLLAHLITWDEVEQQLRSPAYYSYWRNNRLETGRELPGHVLDLDLYDREGRTLLRRNDSLLPATLPERNVQFRFHEGRLLHLHFEPVADRNTPDSILGHVGIVVDLIASMRERYHFAFLQPRSLSVQPFDGLLGGADDVLPRLRFQPMRSLQASPLETLMKWNLLHFSLLLAGLVGLLYFLLRRFVSHPLHALVQYVDGLHGGTNPKREIRLPGLPLREFTTLQDSLQRYQQELDQARYRLDAQNTELLRLAHHDHLTGVWNRRAFDQDWHNLASLLKDQRLDVAYLLFDCDHFKAINDTYGHETGDRVIAVIAETLQKTLRRGDKLYRLGGDEFASIVLNADAEAVQQIAERCHQAVAAYPFNELGIREPIGISIGIAITHQAEYLSLRELPRQADLAMYHAKKQRQRICLYDESMRDDAAVLSSHKVAAVLNAVNHHDNLVLYYQPIHARGAAAPIYYEALVRLQDRQDGLIHPNDIFPIIERHDLDTDFDHAVIKAVENDLAKRMLPADSGVSINLSAASLVDPRLEWHLTPLLPHLHHYKIVLEVTETSLIAQLQLATRNLEKLQRMGFRIALDDFGSGYSSLRYLANMPVDIVKFDITMIQALHESERSRIIIEHIARLIREAGYDLVAEGIEDEATLELVYRMGATHAQGYYLGRPQRPVQREKRQFAEK